MENLSDFFLKERYEKVRKLQTNLEEINKLIDWNQFVELFPKKESNFGRPSYDRVLMIKTLILQNMYGLSDEQIEFQINDRISFQAFLGFPKSVPDYTTIWNFRQELSETNIEDKIFDEFLRQIKSFNFEFKEGHIQDATFIQAQPGKTKPAKEERGRDISKTSRNRDGTWTKKGAKSYFGYKSHTKMQRGTKLIETFAITPANVHDNKIDLAEPNEIIYRDRGYSRSKTKAKGDATMLMGKLTPKQFRRNVRIMKKRAQGEHPYGTIQRSMNGGHTKLTNVVRVYTQQLFVLIGYNLKRAIFLIRS